MAATPQGKAPDSVAKRAWPWSGELQPWAVQHLRQSHEQALYKVGEPTVFTLMWQLVDFDNGLVGRCQTCSATFAGGSDPHIFTDTYKQPSMYLCPECYGSTFEGGWKAQLLRPALWTYEEQDIEPGQRGVVVKQHAAVQTTSDFVLGTGDYASRVDNTRWQLSQTSGTHVRAGYGFPTQVETTIGYNVAQANLLDPNADVSELLPPTKSRLASILHSVNAHIPADAGFFDVVRGPIT